MRIAGLSALSLGLLCGLAGCGSSSRVPVEGVVKRSGKPLANVLATFIPDVDAGNRNGRASGLTDDAGRFRPVSDDGEPGVFEGAYIVILEDMDAYKAPRSEDGTLVRTAPGRIPPKAQDPIRSPFKRAVRAGDTTIEIDIGDAK